MSRVTHRPPLLRYQLTAGQRLTYRFHYESRGAVDLTQLLHAGNDSVGVSAHSPLLSRAFEAVVDGEVLETVVRAGADSLDVEYRLAPNRLVLAINGDSTAAAREALPSDVGRAVFATVATDGRILSLRFDTATASTAQNLVRAVLALMQFVTPARSSQDDTLVSAWTTVESEPSGRYRAEYHLDSGAGADRDAAPGAKAWSVTKRVVPLATSDSLGVRQASSLVVRLDGSLVANFDAAAGVLLSIRGSESQETRIGARTIGNATSSMELEFVRSGRVDPGTLAALRTALANRIREAPALSLVTPPTAADAEGRIARSTAAGVTLDALVERLEAVDSTNGSALATTPTYLQVRAYAYLHPEARDSLAALLVHGNPAAMSFRLLANALAGAGTPATQSALATALEQRRTDARVVAILAPALSAADSPTTVAIAALRAASDETDPDVLATAAPALGAVTRRLAVREPVRAESLVDWISQRLRSERRAALRIVWLAALGNAGTNPAVALIGEALRDTSSEIRTAAISALGAAATAPGDSLVAAALAHDTVIAVRESAARVLSERQPATVARAQQLAAAFRREPSEIVRLALLPGLWAARHVMPEMEQLVRRAAESDASSAVRDFASRLIAPARPRGSRDTANRPEHLTRSTAEQTHRSLFSGEIPMQPFASIRLLTSVALIGGAAAATTTVAATVAAGQERPLTQLPPIVAQPVRTQINPARIEVLRQPAIAFRPFDTLDASGRRLPLDSTITLPNGRRMSLRQAIAQLNEMERQLNTYGYSLRSGPQHVAIARTAVDAGTMLRQAQTLNTAQRGPYTPISLSQRQGRMRAIAQITQNPSITELLAQLQIDRQLWNIILTPPPPTQATVPLPIVNNTGQSFAFGSHDVLGSEFTYVLTTTSDTVGTKLDAGATADIWIVNEDAQVLSARAQGNAPAKGNGSVTVGVNVLGLLAYNKTWNPATANIQDGFSKDFDKSASYDASIGPIPVTIQLGARGTTSVHYGLAVANGSVAGDLNPSVDAAGYAQAGVGDAAFVSAGVGGALTLLQLRTPVDARLTLVQQLSASPPVLGVARELTVLDSVVAMSGALYAYVQIHHPCSWTDPTNWSCYNQLDDTLYAWPGVQTAGTLYSASDYVNFIPNVTAAGTSSAALAGSTTPSNMILALTVVSSTATTKTIVVHAKDAITGQPLHDATVVVYSVSGKTDTPLTYSTTPPDECIETVGGADAGTDPRGHPTKGSTGKVLNTCRGRVTKSGYHVATFKP